MGIVYRNIKDMDVPSFAYPNRHDGTVFIITVDENGCRHRKTIGALTIDDKGKERMSPNQYFKDHYQDLWNAEYPDQHIPSYEISIGMYTLTLSICKKHGIYPDLQDVYGPVYANSMLDYAMFSILHKSGVTQSYESTMTKEVLFADRLYSDSWYSKFFSQKINEDLHHQFRIKRVKRLVANGLEKVWLAMDGSNNDCEARRSYLAKYGFPKSHNANKTIVGYMYAVDAETGRPVTYFVYEGSVPDNQAFQKMSTFLGSFDIKIEGVILDRGFAVEEVFRTIEKNEWQYVVMLPTDTYGHLQMYQKYGEKIRWKSTFILDDEVLFGIQDKQKLFRSHSRESSICMYYDGSGGSLQSVRLSRQILTEKKKVMNAIGNGKRASVAKKLQKFLAIEGEGAARKVVENYEEWDKSMAAKGYFSLAVSDNIDPNRANRLYKMRDTSETQFSILKSQEGGSASRVHKTEGIYSKFALSFLSSIIRFEIEVSCKKLNLDTNPTIQNLDRITLLYTAANKYEATRNLTTEQKILFNLHGLNQDDIAYLARDYNKRNSSPIKNPNRTMLDNQLPLLISNSHKRGRKSKAKMYEEVISTGTIVGHDEIVSTKSKGGRPKGRKDSQPRKPRSDKGKKRGSRKNN